MSDKIQDIRQGGCLCGSARYEIDVEGGSAGNCHCVTCRRHSGAPYETYIDVPVEQFTWLSKPAGHIKTGEKSGRSFCKECGTPLSFVDEDESHSACILVATIDDPSGIKVEYEIYTKDRMENVPIVPGAEQFDLKGED